MTTPYHARYFAHELTRRLLVICPASLRKQWSLEQRQQIFEVEDDIADKRDALIDGLRR